MINHVNLHSSSLNAWQIIQKSLPRIRTNNVKRSYYLTDETGLTVWCSGNGGACHVNTKVIFS